MTHAQATTINPAAGWSGLFWLLIILSAWSGTVSAGMAAETVPTALDADVTPAAVDGEAALPEELSRSDWQSNCICCLRITSVTDLAKMPKFEAQFSPQNHC